MRRIRVAVVCDYPEEGWPSMDLTAEMTLTHLVRDHADEVDAIRVCPPYRRRPGLMPFRRMEQTSRNLDRLINRFVDYPRYLRRLARREPFVLFHIVDHSYAQLVHEVPPGRTIVNCHDLDTFRCLLHPEIEPRPAWFRALTRRTLSGFQSAAAISCNSEFTRAAILDHCLLSADLVTTNHVGASLEFGPDPMAEADTALTQLIGPDDPARNVDLLHVGSNIDRKRIDVLLRTFAEVRREIPEARLIKVGGAFTKEQVALTRDLSIAGSIVVLPFLNDRRVLASLYRRVTLVLQPSEVEGFGLPIAEAMACGAQILASDLPVFREVADEAAVYRPVGDIAAWGVAAARLVRDFRSQSDAWRTRRSVGLARSRLFRWDAHVARLLDLYRKISDSRPPPRASGRDLLR
jgi:glycosyltransferase involved in cell wall biosynthesis